MPTDRHTHAECVPVLPVFRTGGGCADATALAELLIKAGNSGGRMWGQLGNMGRPDGSNNATMLTVHYNTSTRMRTRPGKPLALLHATALGPQVGPVRAPGRGLAPPRDGEAVGAVAHMVLCFAAPLAASGLDHDAGEWSAPQGLRDGPLQAKPPQLGSPRLGPAEGLDAHGVTC